MDYIGKVSKTVPDYRDHLQRLVMVLQSAGVVLNLKKCSFVAEIASNLGHNTRNGRLKVEETMIKATQELHDSTTETEVRLFSSFCEVFRRSVRNF